MSEPRPTPSVPGWPVAPIAPFALLAALPVLAVAVVGQSEKAEMAGYLLLLVFGPFAAALLWAWLDQRLGPSTWARRAERIVQLAACLLLILALGGLVRQATGVPLLGPLLVVALTAFLAGALLTAARGLPARLDDRLARLDRWTVPLLLGSLALFCAIYAPLYPDRPQVSAFFEWLTERPLFPILLLAAWPLAFLAPRLPPLRRGPFAWGLLALCLILALLLFDDGLFRAYDHFVPYVGPALHARRGGVPMVEVYSQYGLLPWVVLSAAFERLPETFGAAAFVVRLFTLAWFVTFLLTVHRLVRDKGVCLLLAAIGLIWAITFHEKVFNLNGLPSTQGYRYLLPALVVLWMAWAEHWRWRGLGLLVLTVVASLWSIEDLLFSAGPVGAAAVLTALRARTPRPLLRDGAILLGGLLAGQGALALYLAAAYGRMPDYRPYFELVSSFEPGSVSHWSVPIPREYGLWIPVALAFFVPLALAARDALAGRDDHPRASSLVPASVLGIGAVSYFVGRSTSTTLGLALLPFLTVALVGLDALLERWRETPRSQLRLERLLVALAVASVVAFSLERFARPYRADQGNATLLRECFDAAGCAPQAVARRLAAGIAQRPSEVDETDPVQFQMQGTGLAARVRDLRLLLDRDFPGRNRIPALIDSKRLYFLGVALFAQSDRWYFWPVSSSLNDMDAPLLRRAILESSDALGPGDLLLVDRERESLLSIWQEAWQRIASRCTLERVDSGAFYDVLALRSCRAP